MSGFPIHIPNKGGNLREAALQFAFEIQRVDHICKELKGGSEEYWGGGSKDSKERAIVTSKASRDLCD